MSEFSVTHEDSVRIVGRDETLVINIGLPETAIIDSTNIFLYTLDKAPVSLVLSSMEAQNPSWTDYDILTNSFISSAISPDYEAFYSPVILRSLANAGESDTKSDVNTSEPPVQVYPVGALRGDVPLYVSKDNIFTAPAVSSSIRLKINVTNHSSSPVTVLWRICTFCHSMRFPSQSLSTSVLNTLYALPSYDDSSLSQPSGSENVSTTSCLTAPALSHLFAVLPHAFAEKTPSTLTHPSRLLPSLLRTLHHLFRQHADTPTHRAPTLLRSLAHALLLLGTRELLAPFSFTGEHATGAVHAQAQAEMVKKDAQDDGGAYLSLGLYYSDADDNRHTQSHTTPSTTSRSSRVRAAHPTRVSQAVLARHAAVAGALVLHLLPPDTASRNATDCLAECVMENAAEDVCGECENEEPSHTLGEVAALLHSVLAGGHRPHTDAIAGNRIEATTYTAADAVAVSMWAPASHMHTAYDDVRGHASGPASSHAASRTRTSRMRHVRARTRSTQSARARSVHWDPTPAMCEYAWVTGAPEPEAETQERGEDEVEVKLEREPGAQETYEYGYGNGRGRDYAKKEARFSRHGHREAPDAGVDVREASDATYGGFRYGYMEGYAYEREHGKAWATDDGDADAYEEEDGDDEEDEEGAAEGKDDEDVCVCSPLRVLGQCIPPRLHTALTRLAPHLSPCARCTHMHTHGHAQMYGHDGSQSVPSTPAPLPLPVLPCPRAPAMSPLAAVLTLALPALAPVLSAASPALLLPLLTSLLALTQVQAHARSGAVAGAGAEVTMCGDGVCVSSSLSVPHTELLLLLMPLAQHILRTHGLCGEDSTHFSTASTHDAPAPAHSASICLSTHSTAAAATLTTLARMHRLLLLLFDTVAHPLVHPRAATTATASAHAHAHVDAHYPLLPLRAVLTARAAALLASVADTMITSRAHARAPPVAPHTCDAAAPFAFISAAAHCAALAANSPAFSLSAQRRCVCVAVDSFSRTCASGQAATGAAVDGADACPRACVCGGLMVWLHAPQLSAGMRALCRMGGSSSQHHTDHNAPTGSTAQASTVPHLSATTASPMPYAAQRDATAPAVPLSEAVLSAATAPAHWLQAFEAHHAAQQSCLPNVRAHAQGELHGQGQEPEGEASEHVLPLPLPTLPAATSVRAAVMRFLACLVAAADAPCLLSLSLDSTDALAYTTFDAAARTGASDGHVPIVRPVGAEVPLHSVVAGLALRLSRASDILSRPSTQTPTHTHTRAHADLHAHSHGHQSRHSDNLTEGTPSPVFHPRDHFPVALRPLAPAPASTPPTPFVFSRFITDVTLVPAPRRPSARPASASLRGRTAEPALPLDPTTAPIPVPPPLSSSAAASCPLSATQPSQASPGFPTPSADIDFLSPRPALPNYAVLLRGPALMAGDFAPFHLHPHAHAHRHPDAHAQALALAHAQASTAQYSHSLPRLPHALLLLPTHPRSRAASQLLPPLLLALCVATPAPVAATAPFPADDVAFFLAVADAIVPLCLRHLRALQGHPADAPALTHAASAHAHAPMPAPVLVSGLSLPLPTLSLCNLLDDVHATSITLTHSLHTHAASATALPPLLPSTALRLTTAVCLLRHQLLADPHALPAALPLLPRALNALTHALARTLTPVAVLHGPLAVTPADTRTRTHADTHTEVGVDAATSADVGSGTGVRASGMDVDANATDPSADSDPTSPGTDTNADSEAVAAYVSPTLHGSLSRSLPTPLLPALLLPALTQLLAVLHALGVGDSSSPTRSRSAPALCLRAGSPLATQRTATTPEDTHALGLPHFTLAPAPARALPLSLALVVPLMRCALRALATLPSPPESLIANLPMLAALLPLDATLLLAPCISLDAHTPHSTSSSDSQQTQTQSLLGRLLHARVPRQTRPHVRTPPSPAAVALDLWLGACYALLRCMHTAPSTLLLLSIRVMLQHMHAVILAHGTHMRTQHTSTRAAPASALALSPCLLLLLHALLLTAQPCLPQLVHLRALTRTLERLLALPCCARGLLGLAPSLCLDVLQLHARCQSQESPLRAQLWLARTLVTPQGNGEGNVSRRQPVAPAEGEDGFPDGFGLVWGAFNLRVRCLPLLSMRLACLLNAAFEQLALTTPQALCIALEEHDDAMQPTAALATRATAALTDLLCPSPALAATAAGAPTLLRALAAFALSVAGVLARAASTTAPDDVGDVAPLPQMQLAAVHGIVARIATNVLLFVSRVRTGSVPEAVLAQVDAGEDPQHDGPPSLEATTSAALTLLRQASLASTATLQRLLVLPAAVLHELFAVTATVPLLHALAAHTHDALSDTAALTTLPQHEITAAALLACVHGHAGTLGPLLCLSATLLDVNAEALLEQERVLEDVEAAVEAAAAAEDPDEDAVVVEVAEEVEEDADVAHHETDDYADGDYGTEERDQRRSPRPAAHYHHLPHQRDHCRSMRVWRAQLQAADQHLSRALGQLAQTLARATLASTPCWCPHAPHNARATHACTSAAPSPLLLAACALPALVQPLMLARTQEMCQQRHARHVSLRLRQLLPVAATAAVDVGNNAQTPSPHWPLSSWAGHLARLATQTAVGHTRTEITMSTRARAHAHTHMEDLSAQAHAAVMSAARLLHALQHNRLWALSAALPPLVLEDALYAHTHVRPPSVCPVTDAVTAAALTLSAPADPLADSARLQLLLAVAARASAQVLSPLFPAPCPPAAPLALPYATDVRTPASPVHSPVRRRTHHPVASPTRAPQRPPPMCVDPAVPLRLQAVAAPLAPADTWMPLMIAVVAAPAAGRIDDLDSHVLFPSFAHPHVHSRTHTATSAHTASVASLPFADRLLDVSAALCTLLRTHIRHGLPTNVTPARLPLCASDRQGDGQGDGQGEESTGPEASCVLLPAPVHTGPLALLWGHASAQDAHYATMPLTATLNADPGPDIAASALATAATGTPGATQAQIQEPVPAPGAAVLLVSGASSVRAVVSIVSAPTTTTSINAHTNTLSYADSYSDSYTHTIANTNTNAMAASTTAASTTATITSPTNVAIEHTTNTLAIATNAADTYPVAHTSTTPNTASDAAIAIADAGAERPQQQHAQGQGQVLPWTAHEVSRAVNGRDPAAFHNAAGHTHITTIDPAVTVARNTATTMNTNEIFLTHAVEYVDEGSAKCRGIAPYTSDSDGDDHDDNMYNYDDNNIYNNDDDDVYNYDNNMYNPHDNNIYSYHDDNSDDTLGPLSGHNASARCSDSDDDASLAAWEASWRAEHKSSHTETDTRAEHQSAYADANAEDLSSHSDTHAERVLSYADTLVVHEEDGARRVLAGAAYVYAENVDVDVDRTLAQGDRAFTSISTDTCIDTSTADTHMSASAAQLFDANTVYLPGDCGTHPYGADDSHDGVGACVGDARDCAEGTAYAFAPDANPAVWMSAAVEDEDEDVYRWRVAGGELVAAEDDEEQKEDEHIEVAYAEAAGVSGAAVVAVGTAQSAHDADHTDTNAATAVLTTDNNNAGVVLVCASMTVHSSSSHADAVDSSAANAVVADLSTQSAPPAPSAPNSDGEDTSVLDAEIAACEAALEVQRAHEQLRADAKLDEDIAALELQLKHMDHAHAHHSTPASPPSPSPAHLPTPAASDSMPVPVHMCALAPVPVSATASAPVCTPASSVLPSPPLLPLPLAPPLPNNASSANTAVARDPPPIDAVTVLPSTPIGASAAASAATSPALVIPAKDAPTASAPTSTPTVAMSTAATAFPQPPTSLYLSSPRSASLAARAPALPRDPRALLPLPPPVSQPAPRPRPSALARPHAARTHASAPAPTIRPTHAHAHVASTPLRVRLVLTPLPSDTHTAAQTTTTPTRAQSQPQPQRLLSSPPRVAPHSRLHTLPHTLTTHPPSAPRVAPALQPTPARVPNPTVSLARTILRSVQANAPTQTPRAARTIGEAPFSGGDASRLDLRGAVSSLEALPSSRRQVQSTLIATPRRASSSFVTLPVRPHASSPVPLPFYPPKRNVFFSPVSRTSTSAWPSRGAAITPVARESGKFNRVDFEEMHASTVEDLSSRFSTLAAENDD